MITINRVFATYDDEGELIDDWSDTEHLSFRELVDAIRYGVPSCYPARGEPFEWVTVSSEPDYQTGGLVEESVHYVITQPDRHARYWHLAFRAAGVIK
jgi:hypothetical protein